jgi:threonine-phosphate decarboxylase
MRKIPPPYTDPAPLFRHGGIAPADRAKLLDFSASINPLGPPGSVLQAIRAALPGIAHYPDPDCRELTEKLAAYHGVEPSQIVVGNGSNELIYAIARACRPQRVAIAEPTYTEYLRASLLVGAQVDHWLAEGDDFDLESFDPEGADLVWLCNPNNPTGGEWRPELLVCWLTAQPKSLFVVDEAFTELRSPESSGCAVAPLSLLPGLSHLKNVIVLRSLTKTYALPGMRLGYAVTAAPLAERIRDQLPTWSVNHLSQVAGLAALQDQAYLERTRDWLLQDGDYFWRAPTTSATFRPRRTHTNFTLLRLTDTNGPALAARLAQRGIAIRDASNFVGLDDHYLRVAIRNQKENERLLAELRSMLEGEPCPAP